VIKYYYRFPTNFILRYRVKMKRDKSRFLITYVTYISHSLQGDDAEEARAEVAEIALNCGGSLESEQNMSKEICLLVTASVPSFTIFSGRDLNCFRFDVFRRIWANSKETRRVDNRFFSATIESSTINARINVSSQWKKFVFLLKLWIMLIRDLQRIGKLLS